MSEGLTDYYCPLCGQGFESLRACWAHEFDTHGTTPVRGER